MNEPLRVGVIGTGAIGRDHIRRIGTVLTGARVVAVSDISADSAAAAVAEFAPGASVLAGGHDVIGATSVDAVLITSWSPTHEEFVLAAIAAGKPCFCEKPLATEAVGTQRIVDAEVAFGRRLVQVGFMRRYDPGYLELKEVVATAIGTPLIVHAVHRNLEVPKSYATPMAIHETAIHEIDVLRWLLGDEYVAAQVVFPRRSRHAHDDLIDPQIVLLETAKGVRIDIEIFVNCRYGYDIQCEVVGDEGVARLPEPVAVGLRKDARRSEAILTHWKDRFVSSYDVELQEFIRAAASGTATGPSAWDGLAAAVTSDACVRAQGSPGDVVRIDLPERPALYG